jgi:hypothetical protein
MRKSSALAIGLLWLASADPRTANAQQPAAKPDAPVVTVGANLKELIFDWEPVEGAYTYWVLEKRNASEHYRQIGTRIPGPRPRAAVPIAVHQQQWLTTRYIIAACNLAGCTRSAPINPQDLMLDTIGYFKASNTDANDHFGGQVALSADGSTMAVSAEGESSAAEGINGDQADNSVSNSGAVYVFRRHGRRWAQEAYVKSDLSHEFTQFGGASPLGFRTLALSANGAVLAVGAPSDDRGSAPNSGVVNVYQRGADGTWTSRGRLSGPPRANDNFGYSVDISSDGLTIKVNSLLAQDFEGRYEGRTHVWVYRLQGMDWSYSGEMLPHFVGDRCPTVRMSASGRLLVSACFSTVTRTGRLVTSRRVGENTWQHVSDVPFPWFENPNMAIDYDGSWLAVIEGNERRGGLGIYRRQGSTWVRDTHVLPFGGTPGPGSYWGFALDFSRHGDYLALGHPRSPVGGRGVMESRVRAGTLDGAVLLFKRQPDAVPQWSLSRIIKAPNPTENDWFGSSVAFGGAGGWYLAVGANGEASAATGVDGNQLDESKPFAGAVFLY